MTELCVIRSSFYLVDMPTSLLAFRVAHQRVPVDEIVQKETQHFSRQKLKIINSWNRRGPMTFGEDTAAAVEIVIHHQVGRRRTMDARSR